MDCTCKTNRYGLPLLDVVGFAATGSTFHLAFAFMRDEKDHTYKAMLGCLLEAYEALGLAAPRSILTDKEAALLTAIEFIFPDTKHITCTWHINMNILKKPRPLLADQVAQARREARGDNSSYRLTPAEAQEDREKAEEGWKKMLQRWNRVVYAVTFEEKDRQWSDFKERYTPPLFLPLLEHIQKEWIDDCQEHFLHCYTSQYLHLNELATSRTESAHWLLKSSLHASNNDLLVVLRSFTRSVEHQFAKVQHKIEN